MERLKKVIEQYGRWSELTTHTDRIEAHVFTDFSHAIENAKALLETIGKEICNSKGVELGETPSINAVMKKTFTAIGYSSDNLVTQISTALANIGQQLGNLRNEIGTTSHGKSLEELRERNNKVDDLTKKFLIDTTVIVAAFLIEPLKMKTLAPKQHLLRLNCFTPTTSHSTISGMIYTVNLNGRQLGSNPNDHLLFPGSHYCRWLPGQFRAGHSISSMAYQKNTGSFRIRNTSPISTKR